jgi:hypothetical protein
MSVVAIDRVTGDHDTAGQGDDTYRALVAVLSLEVRQGLSFALRV